MKHKSIKIGYKNYEFKKIDKDITKLTSSRSTIGIETENIEKPLVEE